MTWLSDGTPRHECEMPQVGDRDEGALWACDQCNAVWRLIKAPTYKRMLTTDGGFITRPLWHRDEMRTWLRRLAAALSAKNPADSRDNDTRNR